MRICVIGSGYVGLVTAACFSEFGHQVYCCDSNKDLIENINKGILPFFEPGLEEIVKNNFEKNLSFHNEISDSIFESSEIFIICVGTPSRPDGSPDLSSIVQTFRFFSEKSSLIEPGSKKIIVIKSTVPVGTTDRYKKMFQESCPDKYSIANIPEFLREGTAVEDFMRPDRVVIGFDGDVVTRQAFERLFFPIENVSRIIYMDTNSSELSKYASNCFLATRISFMNEMANIAEAFDANIDMIRLAVGFDNRIGPRYLYSGPGFGGSCFGKDLHAISHVSRSHGVPTDIIDATTRVNDRQKQVVFKKLLKELGSVTNKKIVVAGVAFKANTDDIRDSPAITFIESLLSHEAIVRVYDPKAMSNLVKIFGNKIQYFEGVLTPSIGADALCFLTEWREFRNLRWDVIAKVMANPLIIDGRNFLSEKDIKENNIVYRRIGKNTLPSLLLIYCMTCSSNKIDLFRIAVRIGSSSRTASLDKLVNPDDQINDFIIGKSFDCT